MYERSYCHRSVADKLLAPHSGSSLPFVAKKRSLILYVVVAVLPENTRPICPAPPQNRTVLSPKIEFVVGGQNANAVAPTIYRNRLAASENKTQEFTERQRVLQLEAGRGPNKTPTARYAPSPSTLSSLPAESPHSPLDARHIPIIMEIPGKSAKSLRDNALSSRPLVPSPDTPHTLQYIDP